MSDLNLKLLAFVPDLAEDTKNFCRGTITPASPQGAREGKFSYFHEGYVDLDIPRDSVYTDDIHAATEGFALADEKGRLIPDAQWDKAGLPLAEKARAGARIALDLPKVLFTSADEA